MPIDVQVVEGAFFAQRKVAWTATGLIEQDTPAIQAMRSFDEVLQLRRSSRLIEGASLHCTLSFIRHVFGIREIGLGDNSGLARKPTISAGALHPIEVIIVAGPQVQEPILFADGDNQFLTLSVKNFRTLANAIGAYREIVPTARGHLLLFTGDMRRVSEKYRPPESLLWRDAGAALQTCAMSAFAYGFGFCPLGNTGRAILEQLHPPHEDFVALALAVFGRVVGGE